MGQKQHSERLDPAARTIRRPGLDAVCACCLCGSVLGSVPPTTCPAARHLPSPPFAPWPTLPQRLRGGQGVAAVSRVGALSSTSILDSVPGTVAAGCHGDLTWTHSCPGSASSEGLVTEGESQGPRTPTQVQTAPPP